MLYSDATCFASRQLTRTSSFSLDSTLTCCFAIRKGYACLSGHTPLVSRPRAICHFVSDVQSTNFRLANETILLSVESSFGEVQASPVRVDDEECDRCTGKGCMHCVEYVRSVRKSSLVSEARETRNMHHKKWSKEYIVELLSSVGG